MKTHHAHATWDSTGWWVTTIPALGPAAVTQSRRLDQATNDIAEVIDLITGESPGDYTLDLTWDDLSESAAEARRLRAESEELAAEAQRATRTAVAELREAGMSLRDIGTLTGVSYQRAQQLSVSDTVIAKLDPRETRP